MKSVHLKLTTCCSKIYKEFEYNSKPQSQKIPSEGTPQSQKFSGQKLPKTGAHSRLTHSEVPPPPRGQNQDAHKRGAFHSFEKACEIFKEKGIFTDFRLTMFPFLAPFSKAHLPSTMVFRRRTCPIFPQIPNGFYFVPTLRFVLSQELYSLAVSSTISLRHDNLITDYSRPRESIIARIVVDKDQSRILLFTWRIVTI